MTTLCLIALIVAVPTGIIGAVCMVKLSRDLNRDQRNGYQLPDEAKPQVRDCPRWMRKEAGK